MKTPEHENPVITRYWLDHYCVTFCTLCGNSGIIDTRGVKTPAGHIVGRLNYCICPNGQWARHAEVDPNEWLEQNYGNKRPETLEERMRKLPVFKVRVAKDSLERVEVVIKSQLDEALNER